VGLVENVLWGKGLTENVRIPSYGGRGIKLLKKPSYDVPILEITILSVLFILHWLQKTKLLFADMLHPFTYFSGPETLPPITQDAMILSATEDNTVDTCQNASSSDLLALAHDFVSIRVSETVDRDGLREVKVTDNKNLLAQSSMQAAFSIDSGMCTVFLVSGTYALRSG